MYARNTRQSNLFMKKQQAERWEHLQKEATLLSNTKLVKRLSDLLILEQRVSFRNRAQGRIVHKAE